jgi:hypothetical protein
VIPLGEQGEAEATRTEERERFSYAGDERGIFFKHGPRCPSDLFNGPSIDWPTLVSTKFLVRFDTGTRKTLLAVFKLGDILDIENAFALFPQAPIETALANDQPSPGPCVIVKLFRTPQCVVSIENDAHHLTVKC